MTESFNYLFHERNLLELRYLFHYSVIFNYNLGLLDRSQPAIGGLKYLRAIVAAMGIRVRV